MKKVWSLLTLLSILVPSGLFAATFTGPVTATGIEESSVAKLPTSGIRRGAVRIITDGLGAATYCTVGGGTIRGLCQFDGSVWAPLGDGTTTAGGAPTDATYITQTCHATLSAEQCLSVLATGILKSTTTTGVVSIATAGTDYVAPAGNVATATALAANGANCGAGNAPLGVDASGAAEGCFDVATQTELNTHLSDAGAHASGIAGNAATATALAANPANCAAGSAAAGVDASGVAEGCAAYLPLSAGSGVPLTGQLFLGGLGIKGQASDTNPSCAVGDYTAYVDLSEAKWKKCTNGVLTDLDTGGGGGSLTVTEVDANPNVASVTSITFPNGTVTDNGSGSVTITLAGSGDVTAVANFGTDNSCIRSDGTGKGVQATGANCTIDDSGHFSTAGSISSGVGSGVAGVITWNGVTGSAQIGVADSAGTPAKMNLPTATGAANAVLTTDGGSPQQLGWQPSSGTGNICRVTSCVMVTPTLGVATATSVTSQTFISTAADPADTGPIRLGNGDLIAWEANPSGTDLTLTVDANNVLTSSVPINATTGFRIGNAASSNLALVGNGTNFVATAIPNSIAGTANEITASGSTGAVTLSLASTLNLSSKVLRIPNSTSLPGTCTVGDVYFDSDATVGQNVYGCTSTNTWTLQGDGGGGGSGDIDTVGDCTTGACFSAAGAGTVLTFRNATSGTVALQTVAGALGTTTISLPATTGTVALTTGNVATATALAANGANCSAGSFPLGVDASGAVESCTNIATSTQTLENKTLDAEGTGNIITIPFEQWFDVAGCDNATAGHVWNSPTANAAAPTCDTGSNTQKAYLAYDATTDESIQGSFVLPTGFTGNIDIMFKWKAAATTGSVGWCMQLVRVPDGSTSDPAFPAQAAGNCVSDAAKGTTLQENDATITNVTCTSCAAGDHVYWRLSRDADGGAVTDDMTGDALLMKFGRRWRLAL